MRVKQLSTQAVVSAIGLSLFMMSSCSDSYDYDDKEPSNLGSSIYGWLQEEGEYTTFLRLVDDLEYRDVLSRTGSKTLFPANDEAFRRFFSDNPYGVTSYEQLSPAQKRTIMNAAMIDMAYLSDMLPNVAGSDGATPGLAIRRTTSASYLDSIRQVRDANVFANAYWSRFKDRGVALAQDAPMMVHFTQAQMNTMGMTADDYSLLYNGKEWQQGGMSVNGVSVVKPDIICKNGYIHVLEDVMLPPASMAEVIEDAPDCHLFSCLLNKFSAPYYNSAISAGVQEFYNGSTPLRPLMADSVFTRKYFNEESCTTAPDGQSLSSYGLLYYDPADAGYPSFSEQDMGAMFVPTDEAMDEFINGSKGSYLRDAYGDWHQVPTNIIALFVKNHQKRSFKSSLPHSWEALTDESSYPIKISKDNVVRTQMANNGAVFFVNTVFPPIDYQGVYASVLTADNTKVMKWAITDDWTNLDDTQAMRFYMYLRSMENMYNLLVPTDEALQNYREPLSWARGGNNREIWSFFYDEAENTVKADIYRADANGSKGDYKRTETSKSVIRNRMRDILDTHIVVGSNDDGQLSGFIDEGNVHWYLTKGGASIHVSGHGKSLMAEGAGDMELSSKAAKVAVSATGTPCLYDSDNGRTFFMDKMLHDAAQSVYQQLGGHPEYKAFYELCLGHDQVFTYFQDDDDIEEIFSLKIGSNSAGLGMVVNSFNNFRYTIFVPTEQALEEAFANDPKLHTWEEIASNENTEQKKEWTVYLLRFIRYHFVDNSAYISGKPYGPLSYETAARNLYDKFHKVTLSSSGDNLSITDERGNTAHVVKTAGLYNVPARDFIVDNKDYSAATNITASSRAVIHLVDKALRFK